MIIRKIIVAFFLLSIIQGCRQSDQIKTEQQLPVSVLNQQLTDTNIDSEKSSAKDNIIKERNTLKCNSLNYKFNLTADSSFITSIILLNGSEKIDSINLEEKTIIPGDNGEADIVIADYNFDNYCDFIIQDVIKASHGTYSQYYYLYNSEKNKFLEDTSIPERVGGIEIDTAKKGLTIYCSYKDCKGTYTYINQHFELSDGEYRNEP